MGGPGTASGATATVPAAPPRVPGRQGPLARLGPHGLRAATWVPLLALLALVVVLVWKAIPAIRYNGWHFFTSDVWNPGSQYAPLQTTDGVKHQQGAEFGAWPLIVGTLESSFIAVLLAVPVAIGTALIVVEKLPPRLSNIVGFFLEVLAGVPSVVFGLWGALTFGPWLARNVAQPIANVMPDVPILRFFRGEGPHNSVGNGEGLLTTGVILAIMILPIIAATTRDLLRQVPRDTVDGAVALGMTDVEATRRVTIPWVRTGIIGATVLGLGRALGETIAVAMVSGALLGASTRNLYGSMNTIAAVIVTQLDAAFTDVSGLTTSTLAECGLILITITLLANVGARLLVRRASRTALPVGRGL
jgi:phosphate transport system permease protein